MNILIVEDEVVVARRLERLLEACSEKDDMIRRADSLDEAAALLDEDIDLVFLDLNLHGQDGYNLLRESVSRRYHTIIVSAYTERAVEAFELGVLDFVPKPFTENRLRQAMERARDARPPLRAARLLFVRTTKGIVSVPVTQILAIGASTDYSELRLVDGRRLLHEKSLSGLERLLPKSFLRVHRAHLVNMAFFQRTHGRTEIELSGGVVVPVSRRRFRDVQRWLGAER